MIANRFYVWYSLMLIVTLSACTGGEEIQLIEHEVDESAGIVHCYKIVTPTATYFLDKEGAGLSSMLDREGTDWIGFHQEPGTGSAGEYRGFPNAVHQQDGSFFHPLNSGTELSMTEVLSNSDDEVVIRAVSSNNNWEGQWDFYPTHCTFTMKRMPAEYKYWILYEGVPGGSYDDSDWYMTSASQERFPLTVPHEGDIPGPEWIAFGDQEEQRCILLVHHEDDEHIDRFYEMRKEMTVFGFGRKGLEKFLDSVPQRFSIAFVESTDYEEVNAFARNLLERAKD